MCTVKKKCKICIVGTKTAMKVRFYKRKYRKFWQRIRLIFSLLAVLGISRDAPKSEVAKSYRKLAGKTHPDRFRSPEDKADAEKKFMQIASA